MNNTLSCFPPSQSLVKPLLRFEMNFSRKERFSRDFRSQIYQWRKFGESRNHSEEITRGDFERRSTNSSADAIRMGGEQKNDADGFTSRILWSFVFLSDRIERKNRSFSVFPPLLSDYLSTGEIDSWSTGEEFAEELLISRGISKESCQGWTVIIEENETEVELMGYDYVLDLIGELEIAPCSPVSKSYFLVHDGRDRSSKVRSNRRQRNTVRWVDRVRVDRIRFFRSPREKKTKKFSEVKSRSIVKVKSLIRSKDWFLKVDNSGRSSRAVCSPNPSSAYKYPRRLSSNEAKTKTNSVVVSESKLSLNKSQTSLSSIEFSDEVLSFPPVPLTHKELFKGDATSAYSVTDDQHEETFADSGFPVQNSPLPTTGPLTNVNSRSNREKTIDQNEERKSSSPTKQVNNKPTTTNFIERKDSLRKTNTFTSSSHSMIDAGCGGHFLSKIPALRCFRTHKQHQTQKFERTSSRPQPPLVVR